MVKFVEFVEFVELFKSVVFESAVKLVEFVELIVFAFVWFALLVELNVEVVLLKLEHEPSLATV